MQSERGINTLAYLTKHSSTAMVTNTDDPICGIEDLMSAHARSATDGSPLLLPFFAVNFPDPLAAVVIDGSSWPPFFFPTPVRLTGQTPARGGRVSVTLVGERLDSGAISPRLYSSVTANSTSCNKNTQWTCQEGEQGKKGVCVCGGGGGGYHHHYRHHHRGCRRGRHHDVASDYSCSGRPQTSKEEKQH